MKKNTSTQSSVSESELLKNEFIQYLNVLFPLIEGYAEPEKIRKLLVEYLAEYQVPAEIESMLKALFRTKFHQPV